jgi:FtsH-binding integral membrane protein
MQMFVGQVFANLVFQTGLALAVARSPQVEESVRRNMLLYVVSSFGLILALAFAKASQPVRFALLTAFSVVSGALLSLNRPSGEVLEEVVRVFVALTIVGFISSLAGLDLRQMYMFMFVALLGLLVARMFTGMDGKKFGAFLFGLFVVVDTNAIMQRNYGGDVVQATLDYFLDFLNLLTFMSDDSGN